MGFFVLEKNPSFSSDPIPWLTTETMSADHRTMIYMSVRSLRVYFICPLTPAKRGQEKKKTIAACVKYAQPTIIWSSLHAAYWSTGLHDTM